MAERRLKSSHSKGGSSGSGLPVTVRNLQWSQSAESLDRSGEGEEGAGALSDLGADSEDERREVVRRRYRRKQEEGDRRVERWLKDT